MGRGLYAGVIGMKDINIFGGSLWKTDLKYYVLKLIN
jgi:hypothetical protein